MRLRQAISLKIVAFAAVATVALSGCGNVLGIEDRTKATIGKCEGTLHLRILGDESSVVREVGIPVSAGIIDFIAWLNDNGGVRGCNVDYAYVDSAYDKPKSTQAYNSWKASDAWGQISAIFAFGTDPLQAVGRPASDDMQVVVGVAYNGDCDAPVRTSANVSVPDVDPTTFAETTTPAVVGSGGYPYVFSQGADYSDAARMAMQYVAQQHGKRVGFFACTDKDYCTQPVRAAKVYIKSDLPGVAIGRSLDLPLSGTQGTYDAAVLAYLQQEVAHKEANSSYDMVDWLWFGNTRATAELAARSIAKAVTTIRGETHTFDVTAFDVKVMANNWAFDEVFVSDVHTEAQGRWWGIQSFPYYLDASASGIALMHQVYDTYRATSSFRPASVPNYRVIEYVYGYTALLAWKVAAEKLIDAQGIVSADSVRGEALKNSFETFQDVNLDGLTAAKVSYTSQDHRPQDSASIYRVDDNGTRVSVNTLQLSLKSEWLGW